MQDIFVADQEKPTNKPLPHSFKTESEKISPEPLIHMPRNTNNSVHLFTSYCKNPTDISFKNQDKNEDVLLFVRKHFITNFVWITIGILLLVIPIAITPLGIIANIAFPILPTKYLLFITLFYYLFVVSYLFIRFITWYFNVSLVTNKRIIDIDFSDVIYKNLASTTLELIQDVSYTQTGVFRTFFHYGDVLVQTAGETINFDFDAVPEPENVVHTIGGLIGKNGHI